MREQLNTPVALIFFTRYDTFEKVFAEVRKAKPKELFLIQDGPRENHSNDLENIEKCRKIAENIDWDCKVYKNYSETNLGCGRRPASGISWVFEHTDRVIILEDDCIPCETFFPYCEEMLERYKDDERISYISGLNHFEEWDCDKFSYFFTKTGAIWGWATWKRAWARYDYYVNAINNTYTKKMLLYQFCDKYAGERRIKTWEETYIDLKNNKKLSFWDAQWGIVKFSQSQFVIVPKYNQIHNIGVGASSSHAQNVNYTKYKKYKNFVFIPMKKLEFPLVHQDYCMCDNEYDRLVYKCISGNKFINTIKRIVKKILKKY